MRTHFWLLAPCFIFFYLFFWLAIEQHRWLALELFDCYDAILLLLFLTFFISFFFRLILTALTQNSRGEGNWIPRTPTSENLDKWACKNLVLSNDPDIAKACLQVPPLYDLALALEQLFFFFLLGMIRTNFIVFYYFVISQLKLIYIIKSNNFIFLCNINLC